MNCKPGDLAIVVRNLDGNIGKLVTVNAAFRPKPGWWICETHGTFLTADRGHLSGLVCIADSALRPIRDPGDDAQDESFGWAPAPKKVCA